MNTNTNTLLVASYYELLFNIFSKYALCYTNPITNTNTNTNTLLVAGYDELLFNILQNMFFVMRMQ